MQAAANGKNDTLSTLIKAGAHIDLQDKWKLVFKKDWIVGWYIK